MPRRLGLFENNSYYHIYSHSIDYVNAFHDEQDFSRMRLAMWYYLHGPFVSLSEFTKYPSTRKNHLEKRASQEKIVTVTCYTLMHNHFHAILRQEKDGGISKYMHLVLGSYVKYYNKKYNRKGLLWNSRFKDKYIDSEKYLFDLTGYIHYNPVEAGFVNDPINWKASSYHEFLRIAKPNRCICDQEYIHKFTSNNYKLFMTEKYEERKKIYDIDKYLLD